METLAEIRERIMKGRQLPSVDEVVEQIRVQATKKDGPKLRVTFVNPVEPTRSEVEILSHTKAFYKDSVRLRIDFAKEYGYKFGFVIRPKKCQQS